jgi:hypothetical protein
MAPAVGAAYAQLVTVLQKQKAWNATQGGAWLGLLASVVVVCV